METTRLCPQCQQPLPADAPSALCPQCLMKAASGPPPSASGAGLMGDIIDIGDPAEIAKKLPQFEILEMLGRGGMGVVYKARQRNLDREVALKILPPLDAQSPDFVARFSREARALAKLSHPNIVNVHDFGEAGGLYYIVMEFVDGANLRQILQTRRLAPAEALAIVPKICDALEYAHEEGLVHRDIKPENLLIDKKGRVKIADFGLAKLLRREPLDMTLTLSGMALGTLRYMAPEQMDKPETVDHRADLYSLGVVIYEMLTGETPVGRFELPSQKAQVDARLDEIVLHALEKEPDRRYQHASEVRTDVEKVTSKPGAAAPTAAASPADEPKAPALHPLPRFFHLRFFVLLLLGWGAVMALWNFGPAGVLAGATILGAIVLEAGRSYALRYPPWVDLLRARSFITRWLLLFFNLFALTLLFAIIIGGLFLLWDASPAEGPGNRITPEEFEAKYKGKEYQLIRNLTAFKEQVPTVELVTDFADTSSDLRRAAVPFAWVCIGCGVLAILFLFQQAGGEQRSLWWLNPGRWRPAFASTGVVVASLLCASVALHWITQTGIDWHIVTHPSVATDTTDDVLKASIEQISTALRNWAAENGFASTQHRWSVQTVPKGETVASVQILEAWKNSPFDRWRMTRSGLVRPFPLLSVQLLTTEKPFEYRIIVDCGNTWVDAGSAKEKQWDAILNSAIDAMRKKAPGIDPKKYTTPPPMAKGTGESPSWTGVCAVLAAAMLWTFLRAHLGSLASKSAS